LIRSIDPEGPEAPRAQPPGYSGKLW